MDSLFASMGVAESGLAAQSGRLKIAAQNIANKDNSPISPGLMPYRRKVIFLKSKFDEALQASKVDIDRYSRDYNAPLNKRFQPYHPASDGYGYVLYPNVDDFIEISDSKGSGQELSIEPTPSFAIIWND